MPSAARRWGTPTDLGPTRRPSNAFFTAILGAGCAPDGWLAVLTPGADGLELDLFGTSGAPRKWWIKVNCAVTQTASALKADAERFRRWGDDSAGVLETLQLTDELGPVHQTGLADRDTGCSERDALRFTH